MAVAHGLQRTATQSLGRCVVVPLVGDVVAAKANLAHLMARTRFEGKRMVGRSFLRSPALLRRGRESDGTRRSGYIYEGRKGLGVAV